MNYKIIFQKSAVKFLKRQDRKTQERLLSAIKQLPQGTDIKKLKGLEIYRMRVGSIRILYTIDERIKIISIKLKFPVKIPILHNLSNPLHHQINCFPLFLPS